MGSQTLVDFQAAVWIAGAPGTSVDLVWQQWTSTDGWKNVEGSTSAPINSRILDPDAVGGAVTTDVPLPVDFKDHPGQALLYAQRQYIRAADGAQITVRSNPLLLTVYGGS
jgi:hypothetical protein